MTAPTEEDIRAGFARAWHRLPPVGLSADATFSDGFSAAGRLLDELYDVDELRPSELNRLDELAGEAIAPIRDEAQREINEALVKAALAFAAEHPEAPRRVMAPQ